MHLAPICFLISVEKIDCFKNKLIIANDQSFPSKVRLKQTEFTPLFNCGLLKQGFYTVLMVIHIT